MGILSIITVVLFQILTSIFDVQLESQSFSSVTQDGRFILNRFAYDLGQAKTISTPSIGTSGASLQFSTGTTTYTYSLSSGNLNLTNSTLGTTDQLNSNNTTVSNLSFLRLADTNSKNDTITISFTVLSKIIKRGGAPSQGFKTTSGIRLK